MPCPIFRPNGRHRNATVVITLHSNGEQYEISGGGTTVTGSWRARGHAGGSLLVQRTE